MSKVNSLIDYELFDCSFQFVDCNAGDLLVCSAVCNAFGIQPWVTTHARQAIEIAKTMQPDVIFIDMEWFNFKLAKKLKTVSPDSGVVIVNGEMPRDDPILKEFEIVKFNEKYEILKFIKYKRQNPKVFLGRENDSEWNPTR